MKGKFKFIFKYILYRLRSKHRRGYGIHSPFLFELIRSVFISKDIFPETEEIYLLKKRLLKNKAFIQVKDLGAGSSVINSENRRVKDIIKTSSVKKKYGMLLFRLVKYFKSKVIIELGTSLGIGTLYLASGNSDSKVFTIEACSETAKFAKHNFDALNVDNIQLIVGNIDEKLPALIRKSEKIDFVYFDGNHQKEATLNYFNLCLKKIHNDSIFYFDDIRWSEEMEEAWNEIIEDTRVRLSIDLFFSGIVFFKKELSKENYVIRF